MPIVLRNYEAVVHALGELMHDLPGVLVTIDGRDGVGKTTLGRYLAWHFNVTLLETDLFLIPTRDHILYLDDQINRIIERRLTTPKPIIVEGLSMLQLMQRIHRVPDFTLYITDGMRRSRSRAMNRRLAEYEAAFSPQASADLVVSLSDEGE
jgi:uridine kinase